MKQSAICLWVACKVWIVAVLVLSNAQALLLFSRGAGWRELMMGAVAGFLIYTVWLLPLVPVLFAFFICGRTLHWHEDEFLFYTVIAGLALTVGIFLFFSYSGNSISGEEDAGLPPALFACGMSVLVQKGAIRRLARPAVLSEDFSPDDNPFNSSTN